MFLINLEEVAHLHYNSLAYQMYLAYAEVVITFKKFFFINIVSIIT